MNDKNNATDTSEFDNGETAWCPGCGNHSILKAVKQAMVRAEKRPDEILIVSGIGQAPKLPQYMKCNMFNGLHGRVLPVATGAKLANPELTVIGVSGDGDAYAEGGNHFLHALRRNIGITYLVHDNQVYGLTRGQTAPTSDEGYKTKTTPFGSFYERLNGPRIAILLQASFVARGFAGEIDHLSNLIVQAMDKPGFSLIDILQPCVTFNKKNTFKWYKDRVYKLEDDGEYDLTDWNQALERSGEWGDRIPIGVLYENDRDAYESLLPALKEGPLVKRKLDSKVARAVMNTFS